MTRTLHQWRNIQNERHISKSNALVKLSILGLIIAVISLFVEWTVFAGSPTSLAQFYYEVLFAVLEGIGPFGILAGQGLTVTTLPQLATLLALFAIPIGLVTRKGIVITAGALMWMYASAATLSVIMLGPLIALAGGIVMDSSNVLAFSRWRNMIVPAIGLIIVPLILAYVFVYHPQVTYNETVVFKTANWAASISVTDYNNCYISWQCPSSQYNVTGFYYVNATAHNTTCWVTSIVNTTETLSKTLSLSSPDSNAVINYMNNQILQTGCNAPQGEFAITHHYAALQNKAG